MREIQKGFILWLAPSAVDGDDCRRSGKSQEEENHELAFVNFTCPALRCIRLSDKVIKDHLIDRSAICNRMTTVLIVAVLKSRTFFAATFTYNVMKAHRVRPLTGCLGPLAF